MDISKFDYEIDPEVKEMTSSSNQNGIKPRYDDYLDGLDDYYVKPKAKKKVNPLYYDENDGRPPKEETYYIVYNNIEFVILAKKLNLLEEYKEIVLANNGEFYNFEDEFFDSRDAERVVEILKEKFRDKDWFIQLLAQSIQAMFDEHTLYDDLTFDLIKKRFFMLDEETLYEAITYLVNK